MHFVPGTLRTHRSSNSDTASSNERVVHTDGRAYICSRHKQQQQIPAPAPAHSHHCHHHERRPRLSSVPVTASASTTTAAFDGIALGRPSSEPEERWRFAPEERLFLANRVDIALVTCCVARQGLRSCRGTGRRLKQQRHEPLENGE